MKVLDIGCGAGTLDFYLASRGCDVTGTDISELSIRKCKDTAKNLKLKNIKFIWSDFPKTKIRGRYDLVILTEVIEHLEDDGQAIKLIRTLLEPKGILFLSTPSKNAPLYKLGLTKEFDKRVGHLRRYNENDLRNLLNENGFRILNLKKNEGVIRNFLFINNIAGKFLKLIKFFVSDLVTFVDDMSLKIFGESDYIIIAKKS